MKSGKWKILWTLFRTMLYISAFTFGGGFVIVTFMKRKFVDEYKWIDENEMLDMTALAQSSPGAIAVNAAILVGRKAAGAPGIAAAVLGTVIHGVGALAVGRLYDNAGRLAAWTLVLLLLAAAAVLSLILIRRDRTVYPKLYEKNTQDE